MAWEGVPTRGGGGGWEGVPISGGWAFERACLLSEVTYASLAGERLIGNKTL